MNRPPKARFASPSVLLTLFTAMPLLAQSPATSRPAPVIPPDAKTWVDADTGHRVTRLTFEPGATGLYFNYSAYSPDGRDMVYTSPAGLHALDLTTHQSRLVVPGKISGVMTGRKSNTVYYVKSDLKEFWRTDLRTGESKKIANLPPRGKIESVNADETLAAGTYIEGNEGQDYGEKRVNPAGFPNGGGLVQPANKGQMMEERLAAKLPMVMFTLNLQTGEQKPILHSTDWLNHLLFSPADPTLLMFCHEGPWHKVDRLWHIRIPDSGDAAPVKLHTRQMEMEIWGHESWANSGSAVWFDLQLPKGEVFYVARIDLKTNGRRWYALDRNEWSIHFNTSPDESMLCGDGGDEWQVAHAPDGKWIYLFKPELLKNTGTDDPSLIQPGVLRATRLVNMAGHNYKLEPNPRFSPDQKQIIFTAYLQGTSAVYAVDVDR